MAEFDDIYKEETIDIKKYIFKILNNWYWFALAVFLSTSTAYIINRYSDRIYQVNSSLLIKETDNKSGYGSEMIQGLELFKQGTNLKNQMGILKSFELHRKVVAELDFEITYYGVGRIRDPELYRPERLKVNFDTSHYQHYGVPVYIKIISSELYELKVEEEISIKQQLKFGEQFVNDYFSFNITIRNPEGFYESQTDEYYFYINNPISLANQYRNKLGINLQDEEGTILTLSTTGYVPEKEVLYLNKLAEVFIRSELEEKNQIAINTIRFIDEQIIAVVDSLSVAEGKLEDFRTENRIIDISQEGRSLYDQYEKLDNEKAVLSIEAKYYNYLVNYLSSRKENEDVIVPTSVGVRDQLLMNLIIQLNTLNSERIVLKLQTVKTNPKLDILDRRIEEVRKMIDENVKNLVQTNQMTIDDLDHRIKILNQDIEKLPYNERKLINIQRRFNLSDQIYTYLLEKRAEAGINRASNLPNARVLDQARVDQAGLIAPKTRLNYMISLIIGLLIPFLIIVLKDYFNNRILSKKDVEARTKAPILGVIGHNSKDTELVVFDNPKSAISESFRTIKTNLQYLLLNEQSKVITVTSTVSGEGKTFCSLNLASIIALTDKKTLLIGMDLRKPRIHRHFGLDNSVGMSTYLIGKASIEDIIVKTKIEGLSVVVSGPIPPNPAKLLETEALLHFMQYARMNFDYVIVDTPPIALVSDALIFSKNSDVNIFVIRQNYSHKDVLDLINELNSKPNIPEFSILINDVQMPGYYGTKYGYNYGYSYGYGYGYGYGEGYYDDEEKEIPLFEKFLNRFKRGIKK
ncbi:MAG: polysaccharide biosynthesis tyrosine autokinase [Salinivirgaceae bacterium]